MNRNYYSTRKFQTCYILNYLMKGDPESDFGIVLKLSGTGNYLLL